MMIKLTVNARIPPPVGLDAGRETAHLTSGLRVDPPAENRKKTNSPGQYPGRDRNPGGGLSGFCCSVSSYGGSVQGPWEDKKKVLRHHYTPLIPGEVWRNRCHTIDKGEPLLLPGR